MEFNCPNLFLLTVAKLQIFSLEINFLKAIICSIDEAQSNLENFILKEDFCGDQRFPSTCDRFFFCYFFVRYQDEYFIVQNQHSMLKFGRR